MTGTFTDPTPSRYLWFLRCLLVIWSRAKNNGPTSERYKIGEIPFTKAFKVPAYLKVVIALKDMLADEPVERSPLAKSSTVECPHNDERFDWDSL